MINKTGIILAGGEGSRMGPLSKVFSKQLIPIFDKPMIFYSLSILILSSVTKVIIVTKSRDLQSYKNLLGNGKQLGISIIYVLQDESLGIPHAIRLCSKEISSEKFLVCLGDNIFHGSGIIPALSNFFRDKKFGAKIFLKYVYNPEFFGVAKIIKKTLKKLVEKPKNLISNYAVTGIYGFDKNIFDIIYHLKLSARGEYEIIDVLNNYLDKKRLDHHILGRGISWLDTGTISNLNKASNFVESLQSMSGSLIGSPEEASFRMKLINEKQLKILCDNYGSSEYGNALNNVIKESNVKNTV